MRFFRIMACAGLLCCGIGALDGCKDDANPAKVPPDTLVPPDTSLPDTRIPIFRDSFETAVTEPPYSGYHLDLNDPYMPFWTLSTEASHSGKSSVKSGANFTGMRRGFDSGISAGTIGCEFYLLAKQAEKINFVVFLGTSGGSAGGSTAWVGMGFDTSDSVKYIFFDGIPGKDYKTVAKIAPGHWYKCKVEYDFPTQTASFFLDDVKVGSEQLINILQFNECVAYRDSSGAQGPKGYYLDDLFCYMPKR